jgi:hypothetical protein
MSETKTCPHCQAENALDASFCAQCGKALPEAHPTGPRITRGKGVATTATGRGLQSDQLEKKAKSAATALFVAAGLQVLGAVILAALMSSESLVGSEGRGMLLPIVVACGVLAMLFAGLGIWARRDPLPAAIVGLVLFVSLMVLNLLTGAGVSLVQIIIAVVLGKAVAAGVQHRRIRSAAATPVGGAEAG